MINKVTIPYHTISYRGYRRLQEVTKGYKGLKGGYRGLQGLTRGYKGLQGVTRVAGGYKGLWHGMVWQLYLYTLFPSGTLTFNCRKTNYLTNLESKIKTKIIKMKRKHLLFKEAVCKNRISLIKLFVDRSLCLLIFP